MSRTKPPTREHFRFRHRLRVRWAEVDMQKIVFNPHYLMYFDTAICDYWRALALPYEAAMHKLEGDLYVKKASVEYFASARYDDLLDIGLRCERIGNSSMQFGGGIFRGDEILVSGELLYVFANPQSQTSCPVPAALRETLLAFEAGEPSVRSQIGAWAELGPDARALRTEVFVQEQRIPVELEWDELDEGAIHVVTWNRLGMPVATARLTRHSSGVSRIGRMAVSRVLRGTGLGRGLVHRLLQQARARGDHEVMLHAQRSAEGFYRGLGFKPRGQEFEEAGIAHIEMFQEI